MRAGIAKDDAAPAEQPPPTALKDTFAPRVAKTCVVGAAELGVVGTFLEVRRTSVGLAMACAVLLLPADAFCRIGDRNSMLHGPSLRGRLGRKVCRTGRLL